ncbi:F0F1 ATP synthase subunit delta [soil metagenome]
MRQTTIARNYAEALLALAQKADDLEGWGRMLDDIAGVLERDPTFRNFMASPRVSAAQKSDVLAKAFSDRVPQLFLKFLHALVRNRRQMLLPEIAVEYHTLVDEVTGRVHARVTVARETDDAEQKLIADRLSKAIGKTVVPHLNVDPRILGGVVVRVGDTVMDGSLRKRLATLKRRMVSSAT